MEVGVVTKFETTNSQRFVFPLVMWRSRKMMEQRTLYQSQRIYVDRDECKFGA